MSGVIVGKNESSTSRSGGSAAHLSILMKKSNNSNFEMIGPSARSKNSTDRINPLKSQVYNQTSMMTPTSHIAYDPNSDSKSNIHSIQGSQPKMKTMNYLGI